MPRARYFNGLLKVASVSDEVVGMGAERRVFPRVEASLEVQIVGIDRRAILRRGDIGLDGLFVETDVDPGEPGAIHALRLRSRDKAIRVEVPGRVSRVSRSDDLLRGAVVNGVAFELLPYEPGKRDELAALVLHVARHRSGDRAVAPEPEATEAHGDRSVSGLSIEMGWRLRKGERVRVEVPTPEGGSVTLEGRAVRSRRSRGGSYRTRVEVAQPSAACVDRSVSGLRDALGGAQRKRHGASRLVPLAARCREHLGGELAHIGLPSVLSLAGIERMTGVVQLARGPVTVRLYLRDGDVVDVVDEGDADTAPREVLAELLRWDEGTFSVLLESVDRPDRIGVPTTALLLDLAREHDEQRRVA